VKNQQKTNQYSSDIRGNKPTSEWGSQTLPSIGCLI